MRASRFILPAVITVLSIFGLVAAQLQQSGGGGSNASVGTYPAAAPGSATLHGGQFKTTPPTLTDGQMGAIMLDNSGNTKVAIQSGTVTANQGGAPWSTNQTQINGIAVLAGNGATGTGSQRVTIANDNSPLKTIPLHGCTGNALQDITTVDVATGAGTAATSADTCVFYVYANNKTGSAVTLTVQDKSGTPIVYSTTFSIPANSDVRRDFAGHKFLAGVQLIAGTASALNVVLMGVQ